MSKREEFSNLIEHLKELGAKITSTVKDKELVYEIDFATLTPKMKEMLNGYLPPKKA